MSPGDNLKIVIIHLTKLCENAFDALYSVDCSLPAPDNTLRFPTEQNLVAQQNQT